MPSNIEHANISAIKLGTADVTAGYIGNEQVYPNSREIQSAAFTNTSTLLNSGGSRLFRVTGETGATYDLTGSGAGSYILPTSPYDHTISVGANNACGASGRTITTTLTPTGSTVLQGGGGSFTSSFSQQGGPSMNNVNATASISATNTNRVTTTVGGSLYWAAGSSWSISYSSTSSIQTKVYLSAFGSGNWSASTSINGSNVSGTITWTMTSTQLSTVRFYMYMRPDTDPQYTTLYPPCNYHPNSPVSTGYLYP